MAHYDCSGCGRQLGECICEVPQVPTVADPIAFILNGPPSSGKDTLAEAACRELQLAHGEFKGALYADTARVFDIAESELRKLCVDRSTKEVPLARFGWKSPREALQFTSEQVMKVLYGKQYYGRKLGMQIMSSKRDTIVSDGGFPEEIAGLTESGVKVVVIRLERDGCSYAGDTRKYLDNPRYIIRNNEEIEFAVARLVTAIKQTTQLRGTL